MYPIYIIYLCVCMYVCVCVFVYGGQRTALDVLQLLFTFVCPVYHSAPYYSKIGSS